MPRNGRRSPCSTARSPACPTASASSAASGTTVALLLEADAPYDRVELVRRGAQRLLPADASADAIVDALLALTESRRPPAGRILAIDDDPSILLVMEAILGGSGYEVTVLEDPLAVWAALERTRPDLVVCDVDMPGLDGIDLCRTLRADARWQNLPLLFLTGHSDAETVSALFAAGADDYVTKPVLGPELLARVRNRIERVALQREIDDVDRLTGLLRRDAARPELDGLLKLGRRLGQPVAIAAVAVDELGRINREAGHVAGDAALAAAGRALRATFGSDGVAARWGGGELVVGMLGLGSHDARDRVGAVLEELRGADVAGRRVTAVGRPRTSSRSTARTLDALVGAAGDARRVAPRRRRRPARDRGRRRRPRPASTSRSSRTTRCSPSCSCTRCRRAATGRAGSTTATRPRGCSPGRGPRCGPSSCCWTGTCPAATG